MQNKYGYTIEFNIKNCYISTMAKVEEIEWKMQEEL